ncbi:MAG TPA: hypothetical protein DCG75_12500 [Bacteroidales bacterium]|nr:hypothetical protein [Bacteroidales bacterium]
MEKRTEEFIEILKNLSGENEISERVISDIDLMKKTLQSRGYEFYTVEHTDDLVGGQGIYNKDVDLVEHYKEVAYIKRGVLTGEWVSMFREEQRYDEIRDAIRDILET